MRAKQLFVVLVMGLCGYGCSAASDDAMRGDGTGTAPSNSGKTIAGGKGGGTGGSNPGFGNTTQTPGAGQAGVMAAAPDAGCVEGTRCFDENAPDHNDCGHQDLNSNVTEVPNPGNVLLVFDTSGSMADKWNDKPRWQAVGDAIKSALMPLQDMLTVGTVFFPRPDPNAPPMCIDPTGITCLILPGLVVPGGTCGVSDIASADQINFVPGAQFLTTFAGSDPNGAPPYAPVPGGLTPLKEGLQQAQAALASTTLTGTTAVIVITDGDPNCGWDEAVSTQIVTDWHANGIDTYVLGVPGLSDDGLEVLNNLAAAGGTGTYISPDDPAALGAKIGEIVKTTVTKGIDSCTIALNPPAEAPEKLHLVVKEMGVEHDVPRQLSDTASWSVTADGATVTLEGDLCTDAQGGRFDTLTFQFGCVELPPLEPEKPD
jgi:hypothetical protein